MNSILQQDDAAPDSLEYFERDFLKITGVTMTDFQMSATRIETDAESKWVSGPFKLTISADHPFYTLYSASRISGARAS